MILTSYDGRGLTRGVASARAFRPRLGRTRSHLQGAPAQIFCQRRIARKGPGLGTQGGHDESGCSVMNRAKPVAELSEDLVPRKTRLKASPVTESAAGISTLTEKFAPDSR